MCKINLKCVLHQEIRVSPSVSRHFMLNWIFCIWFLRRSSFCAYQYRKPHWKASLKGSHFCTNMTRTYGAQPIALSFLSRSYLQTKKPDRESWRASKQFVVATASFMASGSFILSKDLLILHKMINWRNPRLFSVLIFLLHSGFLQEFTGQMFKIYRPFRIKM